MNFFKNYLSPYKGLSKEIYIIAISKMINAMGCFSTPLITLLLVEKIGLNKAQAGFVLTIASLTYIFPLLVGGKIADIFDRKKILIVFRLLSGCMYVLCVFIQPSMIMIYLLIFSSACSVFAGPSLDSLVADLTSRKNRKSAYSLNYLCGNVGLAMGPLLGGFLYKDYINILFLFEAITTFGSISLIILFVSKSSYYTHPSKRVETSFLEKNVKGSILFVLMERPVLIIFAIIMMGYQFGYSQWGFLFPMHVSQNFGNSLSGIYIGTMASFNGLIVVFLTPLFTKLLATTKHNISIFIGGLLYTFGFGILGFFDTLSFFYLSVLIFTLGEIVISICSTTYVMEYTPTSHRGRMSAVINLIIGTGSMLGPLTMGKIVMLTGIKSGWLIVGMIILMCSFFAIKLKAQKSMQT